MLRKLAKEDLATGDPYSLDPTFAGRLLSLGEAGLPALLAAAEARLRDCFDEAAENEAQHCIWAALTERAWRRGHDFVVFRAERLRDEAEAA